MPGEKNKNVQIVMNPNAPTLFVDNLSVSRRLDGMCLVQFLVSLPQGMFEQCKIMVHENNLKTMTEVLLKNLDAGPKQ